MVACIISSLFFYYLLKMSDVVLPIEKSSKEMSKFDYDFKIPYYPESDEAKLPYKATPDAAAYDFYAAENKDVLPKSNVIVSLDLRWAIPKGFFGKVFLRSGLFLDHKITAEAGVIDSGYRGIVQVLLFNHSDDSGYRGIVQVLLFNHSDDVFSVKVGQQIAQVVFLEHFDVKFEMVQSADLLPKSVRNEGGFGSTGI